MKNPFDTDTITINLGQDLATSASSIYKIASTDATMQSSPSITISDSTSPYNYNWINTGTGIGTTTTNGWGNIVPDHSLHVRGDADFEGDVKIKGKSIVDSLEKIEEKLAILRPNEQLEEKWDQLRELRKQYMELEKEIIEKEKVWDILKK